MSKNCCALKCVIICHKMPKELVVSCQLPVVCRRVRGSGFSEGEAGGLRVEGGGDELRGALNHLRSTFNPLTSILNPPTSTLQPRPSTSLPSALTRTTCASAAGWFSRKSAAAAGGCGGFWGQKDHFAKWFKMVQSGFSARGVDARHEIRDTRRWSPQIARIFADWNGRQECPPPRHRGRQECLPYHAIETLNPNLRRQTGMSALLVDAQVCFDLPIIRHADGFFLFF